MADIRTSSAAVLTSTTSIVMRPPEMSFIALRLRCIKVVFTSVANVPLDGIKVTRHRRFNILEVTTHLQVINIMTCIIQMLRQAPWLQALTFVHSVSCLVKALMFVLLLWNVFFFPKLGAIKLSIKWVRLDMNATEKRFLVILHVLHTKLCQRHKAFLLQQSRNLRVWDPNK